MACRRIGAAYPREPLVPVIAVPLCHIVVEDNMEANGADYIMICKDIAREDARITEDKADMAKTNAMIYDNYDGFRIKDGRMEYTRSLVRYYKKKIVDLQKDAGIKLDK